MLRGSKGPGPGPRAPHHRRSPTMLMCLAVCTCACHFVIFIRKESLFADAIKLSIGQTAVFHLYNISFNVVTKQLLQLLHL